MPGKLSHVALRTSLLYALVAAVWILVSDKVLVALVHDPVIMEEIAVCKGWAFVAVTALLLFGALRGQLRRWEQEAAARRLAEAYLAEAQRLSHTGSFGWNVATDEHYLVRGNIPHFRIRCHDEGDTAIGPRTSSSRGSDPRARDAGSRGAQERRDFDYEHRLLMPNGSVKHLHVVARAVRQEPGNVEFIGAVMDVTAQKRAEESLRRLNRELRAISNCNQTLMRATDEQTLLQEICRIVCEEAGYRMAWVGYCEHDEAKSVRPVAWAGMEDGYLATANITWADTERGRGLTGTAARCGTSTYIQDFTTDPSMAPWREGALKRGYRSCIALPLKDESASVFGVLTIYSSGPNAFSPDEIRLLEELAGDLAFGIMVVRARVERDEAEASLALRSFALDNVREAAFLIDEHARFHYVNEASCRILAYPREELLAMDVWDIDPDFPKERWPDHWRALRGEAFADVRRPPPRQRRPAFSGRDQRKLFGVWRQGLQPRPRSRHHRAQRAEEERLAHLRFFEAMDRVNRATHGADDLEQMMSGVLDAVLAIFECDRAFLQYPCDPGAAVWRVHMERCQPEYPGVLALGVEVPMDPEVAESFRILLASDGPVKFGPHPFHPVPAEVSERFGFKSFMSMAIHPKVGKAWEFGIHQCSYARVWTAEEERLFHEIGRRLA